MVRFALEYMIDCNGTRAVIDAGYSEKGASVRATKLLKNKLLSRYIGKLMADSQKQYEVDRNEILRQLVYCATRSGEDFVDDTGKLIENINELPERARNAIDGIKQKVKRYKCDDGTEVEEVTTELRMVSKAAAMDMAMRHKGLFAAEKHDHQVVTVDWDKLVGGGNGQIDEVERKVLEAEQKAIEVEAVGN